MFIGAVLEHAMQLWGRWEREWLQQPFLSKLNIVEKVERPPTAANNKKPKGVKSLETEKPLLYMHIKLIHKL